MTLSDEQVRARSRGAGCDPIAVVGMACRFPGAADSGALWELLEAGGTAVGERERSLAGALEFDAGFFEISAREAGQMDPQQRLLLEVCYEAVQDAGWTASWLAGSDTGVYVAQTFTDYWDLQVAAPDNLTFHALLGSLRAAQSGRIAYALDLRGPAVSVDTACSSSLSALHLAAQALRTRECRAALVGGAHLVLSPFESIAYGRAGMLSERGVCAFGDESADGFARADGVAVVALKRLEDAVADGDRVRAVLLATAVNSNGRGYGALAEPALRGQVAVLHEAYRRAGVDPHDVDYVEAHGTGTRAGDPVELAALAEVLGAGRAPGGKLLVGSVKANIGHCEATAGLAGLIKTVLCLEHRRIPGQPHLAALRSGVDWSSITVPVESTPLASGPRLIAGVSATGLSGCNAHAVLAAFESPPTCSAEGGSHLLALSARTESALRATAAAWSSRLGTSLESVRDLAFTAAVRRDHFAHRLAIVGADRAELAARLAQFAAGDASAVSAAEAAPRALRAVFVFPGQGGQWAGMGRELLAEEPVFRAAVEGCDRAVRDAAGWSVLEVLRDAGGEAGGESSSRPEVVQPVLWAVQVGLAALWRAWGVEPAVVIGHSMGEIAAACTAGALSLVDGAWIVARRSELAARTRGTGAMASVALSAGELAPILAPYGAAVCVAAANGPRSSVISGEADAVRAVVGGLEELGVQARLVRVDFASHSPLMDPLLPELQDALGGLEPGDCSVPIRSTVTGARIEGSLLDSAYWTANLRNRVCLADAVAAEHAVLSDAVFIEISPHPVLLADLREIVGAGFAVASTRRGRPERAALLGSLGELYLAGRVVPGLRVFGDTARFVPAPASPWQHETFPLPGADTVARAAIPVPRPIVTSPDLAGSVPVDPETLIRRHVAAVLGERPELLDARTPLRQLGLDSVLGAELRARLAVLSVAQPPLRTILAGSIADLVAHVRVNAAPRSIEADAGAA